MAPAVSYREAMARLASDLPYYAWEGLHPPTGRYRPDYVELFLVTAGEGRRTLTMADGSSRTTPMLPGGLYIYRPMDVLELVGVGRAGYSVICVAFPFQTWEKFGMLTELDQRLFTRPEPPAIATDLADPRILEPFRRILESFRARPDAMDLTRFLVDTIPWFVEEARAQERPGAPTWLWTAITAMYDEPNLRAGVGRLAELCHVSHTHLWRNTRTYFGFSPSELVNEIRLRHAALLLVSTDDPVASIGERCGFSTPSHFSKAFRRSRLIAPRAYRIRTRAGHSAGDRSAITGQVPGSDTTPRVETRR